MNSLRIEKIHKQNEPISLTSVMIKTFFKKSLDADGDMDHSQKSNNMFLMPLSTFPENFIKLCPKLFELVCKQTYARYQLHNLLGCGNSEYLMGTERRFFSTFICEEGTKS